MPNVACPFFDALTMHAKVKEAYQRWQNGLALFSANRTGFTFAGRAPA